MPSTPTTKSQVQAYKFVIRRMQSALVRKDAVMLHDPMRTHIRAVYVGIALAILGLAIFLIIALFSRSPALPKSGIVISEETGQIYVLNEKPRYLTPVFNMASARLLLMAQQEKSAGQAQQAGQQVNAPDPATVVEEQYLQGIRKQRKTGILDGPEVLPGKDSPVRARGKWGVCDRTERDPTLNNPTQERKTVTTAMVGVDDFGTTLAKDQSLVVSTGDGEDSYLIYRTPEKLDQSGSDAVRAKVDLSNPAVDSTFGPDFEPRKISPGLLNAIPPVNELKAPEVPGEGGQGPAPGLTVGSLITVENVDTENYIVLQDGLQQVSESVASLLNYQTQPTVVPASQIANVRKDLNVLELDQFPEQVPNQLPANDFPTVCLAWQPDLSDQQFPKQQTVITVGKRLPIDPKSGGSINPDDAVKVGTPNPDGLQIDRFWMPHGKAAVVHSATGPTEFQRGPIYVITDRGVRYSIPDVRTAVALGVSDGSEGAIDPAPDSIVRLLPGASELSVGLVDRTFDSVGVPDEAGRLVQLPPKPTAGQDADDANPNVPGGPGGSAP